MEMHDYSKHDCIFPPNSIFSNRSSKPVLQNHANQKCTSPPFWIDTSLFEQQSGQINGKSYYQCGSLSLNINIFFGGGGLVLDVYIGYFIEADCHLVFYVPNFHLNFQIKFGMKSYCYKKGCWRPLQSSRAKKSCVYVCSRAHPRARACVLGGHMQARWGGSLEASHQETSSSSSSSS